MSINPIFNSILHQISGQAALDARANMRETTVACTECRGGGTVPCERFTIKNCPECKGSGRVSQWEMKKGTT